MSNQILIALSVFNLILVIFIIWDRYKRAKELNAKPQVTVESITSIVNEALQRLISQKLGENSSFFTDKMEKSYQENLQNALSDVQKEETKLNEEAVKEFTTLEQSFKQHLVALEEVAKQQHEALGQRTAGAQNQYENFLKQLGEASQKSQFQSMEGAKQKVDKLFEDFEVKLADFLLQSEQKMMLAVDLELRSARQLIDTYKVQQMNVIDENIMAMLEKTLSLVLAKNLNLKDQMDLVYDSLEKAKAEKFVV